MITIEIDGILFSIDYCNAKELNQRILEKKSKNISLDPHEKALIKAQTEEDHEEVLHIYPGK